MLPYINSITCLGVFFSFCIVVQAQNPRCFQFTWLGPDWSNESIIENATCSDATQLARGVPCFHPLVVTYDSTPPDTDYIWENYPEASCVLGDSDVCAKYTYSFGGIVLNSTYFCTKAKDNEGHVIQSGCHQQVNGSSTTRVCFCRSQPGGTPCNNSFVPSLNNLTFTLIAVIFVLQNCFKG